MSLTEAGPGDRLTDTDGDIWTRTVDGAVVVAAATGVPTVWPEFELPEADVEFGPFRLVSKSVASAAPFTNTPESTR